MPTLLRRIQIGIGAGTALAMSSAGCSSSIQRTDASVDASSSDTGLADTGLADTGLADTGLDDAAVDSGGGLQPYPLALGCRVAEDGSDCCRAVQCLAGPDNCVAPELRVNPPPAWAQSCGVTGPFAPNPDDPNMPFRPERCCYVVGFVVVEGRPVFLEERSLVAPVVTRSDWAVG